ncbi:MAG: GntR family transcriptional regulator [Lachnospiraceae bacterium]
MSSYELVYQKLRENILNGHYKHGDELRETAVGKEIGVSRTPVREALRQLELAGLVTIIPNRGAFVNGISEQDVQDIYLIRARLRGLLCGWRQSGSDESTHWKNARDHDADCISRVAVRPPSALKLTAVSHSSAYEAACKSKILEHELKIISMVCTAGALKRPEKRSKGRTVHKEHMAVMEAIKARYSLKKQTAWQPDVLNSIKTIIIQNRKTSGKNSPEATFLPMEE